MTPIRLAALLILTLSCYAQSSDTKQDIKQRVKAARELAKNGSRGIAELEPYLSDREVAVRAEAVKAVADIGTQYSLDPLLKATSDNDPEIQIRATDGLVNFYLPGYLKTGIGGSIKRVGTAIKGRFTDTNDQVIDPYVQVRPEVIRALGRLVRSGSSMDSRANAARAIGILRGKVALPDLIEALRSKGDIVIYESLIALQKIRDPAAAPRITFLLRDLNERVQTTALETTGLLQNNEAAPDVREALRRAKSIKVRRSALTALAMLPVVENRGEYATYFVDPDDGLRAAAAEGYARLNNPADLPAMEKAFLTEGKTNPRLSDAFAVVSLGKHDMSESGALRYLVNTLNSKLYRGVAQAFLVETTRDPAVRGAIYPALTGATKDEKIQLAQILAASGDRITVKYLDVIAADPDTEISQEGVRSLRILKARLP